MKYDLKLLVVTVCIVSLGLVSVFAAFASAKEKEACDAALAEASTLIEDYHNLNVLYSQREFEPDFNGDYTIQVLNGIIEGSNFEALKGQCDG